MSGLSKVNTPCVGICSTVYGDDVCRGCKRTYTEVIDWNAYPLEQREDIFKRLEDRQQEVMADKVDVIDATLLEQVLIQHYVRYRPESDPLCWAYHVLRCPPREWTRVAELSAAGVSIKEAYKDFSIKKLFTVIDEELFLLSSHVPL